MFPDLVSGKKPKKLETKSCFGFCQGILKIFHFVYELNIY